MLKQKVQQFILENSLFRKQDKILIGLSGGADSVALLEILLSLNYKLSAAHCNFHLRGEESTRDENFTEKLANDYGIEFHTTHFDTEDVAKEKSISIEMAARNLRYEWFEELRLKHQFDYIATAHHRDDSVETVLLNLIRGTGIRGLTGISAKNNFIVRPFLETSREEIESFLEIKKIAYVDDSSNFADIYTRNKIRLKLLPLMETINPSVKQSINNSSKHLKSVYNIYKQYIVQVKNQILVNDKIDIKKLTALDEAETILYEILLNYGFNGDIVNNIYRGLTEQSGQVFYSVSHEVLKDREFLIIREKEYSIRDDSYLIGRQTISILEPIRLKLERIERDEDFKIEKNTSILYLDEEQIEYPLRIRKWKIGDWFIPFGMKGRKKLSDYFTDQKISLFDKENIYLLCSESDILWVIGHRSDERYKITNSSHKILKISLD